MIQTVVLGALTYYVGKIPINIYVLAAADGLIGDYQLLHADISGGYLAISPHGKYWYVC